MTEAANIQRQRQPVCATAAAVDLEELYKRAKKRAQEAARSASQSSSPRSRSKSFSSASSKKVRKLPAFSFVDDSYSEIVTSDVETDEETQSLETNNARKALVSGRRNLQRSISVSIIP
eukprot:CAMPEP_0168533818 /NCGR_PEP_ID=MMETSP0405-20121227/17400_1 /TAXON_ID=498012 /ORGANISM="Trichosphaerium sp, Strain Am-I-7 wt" /LENGTH=118 /DNA_ID=CAMNT_0008560145 /DNA_START=427 /DNA_END=779 /DNA_ORIENTATION=+